MAAKQHSLKRLFQPQSIAVFGGAWAENVIIQLKRSGFSGDIWPVHPKKSEVAGLSCYRSVADLPNAPDASFIGVNRALTPQILAELRAVGAGGAICFASGFAETAAEEASGRELQSALIDAAGDMPVLGPNCYGFINYLDDVCLWPDQHGGKPIESGVAIIMQSSNIAISLTMQKRSCPIAYMVTAGNQASVSQADIAMALLDDPRVSAIGMHIEGFVDVDSWHRLAHAAKAAGKPIIALKMGKSEQAIEATQSHTASLAGSDAGAEALLKRFGIARLSTVTAFLETLKFLHHGGIGVGAKLVSLSCSGGEASLVADAAMPLPLSFPPLTSGQKDRLKAALGALVHLSNPLDYQTYIWGDAQVMQDVFTAALDGEADLGFLIFDPPREDRCDASSWRPALDAFLVAARTVGKPAAVIATIPELMTEDWADHITASGVVPMGGLEDAFAAFAAADFISRCWNAGLNPEVPIAVPTVSHSILINEAEAKDWLRQSGLPVPIGKIASNPDLAAAAADQIGYPVVLKGLGFAHKTDAGAICLNLKDSASVARAAHSMGGSQGYLVEQMVGEVIAELLIGVVVDPAHGMVLTLGAGGVMTEILQDTQSLILPTKVSDIKTALSALQIAPILQGYRGKTGTDIENLARNIHDIADFAVAHSGKLTELEINPYMVQASAGIIADCLLMITKEETEL